MVLAVLLDRDRPSRQLHRARRLGPPGARDIGTRIAPDWDLPDLRFFVSATGIYDNGLQPYSLDGNGQLATVNGLWGTEVAAGAYGVHKFRHAKLGLDYKGTYRHYDQKSFYDGTDHILALGYTHLPAIAALGARSMSQVARLWFLLGPPSFDSAPSGPGQRRVTPLLPAVR